MQVSDARRSCGDPVRPVAILRRVSEIGETKVGHNLSDYLLVIGGFGLVGLGVGWALPRVASWAVDTLPAMPFEGPLRLIADWQGPVALAAFLALGVLAGLGLGVYAIWENLKLTVTDDDVRITVKGSSDTFDRADIAAVFSDGKKLVLQGHDSTDLARYHRTESAKDYGAAFTAHDYPWHDEDPYQAQFRRWVPDTPELDAGANAVLAAREKALATKDATDIEELRTELSKLGIVVRETDKRQYWRSVSDAVH